MSDHVTLVNDGWTDIEDDDLGESVGPFETDFDALLQRRAESSVEQGVPLDDLEKEWKFSELKRAEENKLAPFVRTTPRSALNSGVVLGQQVTVVSGGQEQDAVYWPGGEDSDEPTDVTITLSNVGAYAGGAYWPTAQNPSATPYSYRPYAVIRWGCRGVEAQVTVDIGRGCQLKVSGSSVYVKVGMDAAPSGRVAGSMQVAAMLAFKNVSLQQPIIRTAYVDALADTSSQTIVVPNFAQQLLPVQRADLAGAILLQFLDTNGTVLYARNIAATQVMTESIPISDDCYSVKVNNNSGIGTALTARLMFGLSV